MRIDRAFAIRALALVFALLACAWFALSIRQAHDTARAQAILSAPTPLTVAQADRADSLLHSAGFLNPDREVDLLRAQVDADRRNIREADRILFAVVRAEPMNADAWYELVSNPLNPRIYGEAARAVFRLVHKL